MSHSRVKVDRSIKEQRAGNWRRFCTCVWADAVVLCPSEILSAAVNRLLWASRERLRPGSNTNPPRLLLSQDHCEEPVSWCFQSTKNPARTSVTGTGNKLDHYKESGCVSHLVAQLSRPFTLHMVSECTDKHFTYSVLENIHPSFYHPLQKSAWTLVVSTSAEHVPVMDLKFSAVHTCNTADRRQYHPSAYWAQLQYVFNPEVAREHPLVIQYTHTHT